MKGTQRALPPTPRAVEPAAPADLLSDLLSTVRISGAVLFRAEFREPWAIAVCDAAHLARALPFRTELLLKARDKPVKAVAAEAGYVSEFAFSRAFKRVFGLPPADWRRRRDGS